MKKSSKNQSINQERINVSAFFTGRVSHASFLNIKEK